MAANIFGERFFGKRQPAWHRIGTVMDTDATVTEAMKYVDVDFQIYTTPTYISLPDGTQVETDHNAIVREPTTDDPQHRILSVVGGDWTPIQMQDLANFLDPISEKYPVETLGALGHGEKIFLTLDAGESAIAGEHHKLYYLITDHRDGRGALTIAFTPVRVVCQNTLTTGLNQAKVSVSLSHNKMIKADTQWYTSIFNSMLSAQDQVVAQMNQLAEWELEDGEVNKILNSAYPKASPPRRLKLSNGITEDDVPRETWLKIMNDTKHLRDEYDKRVERVEKIRAGALERFHAFNDEFPRLANTPWAMWQAVVETEDYRRGHTDSATALFGQRANTKARAFKTALECCR